MRPKLYTKKPIRIEALQVSIDADDFYDLVHWLQSNLYVWLIGDATNPETLKYPDQAENDDSRPDKGIYINPATGFLMIRTIEGDMQARPGSWVVKGVQGEFYPVDADIFSMTYTPDVLMEEG